jgi:glycosyltransferase involved in cell wall biosynthesis
MKILMNRKPVNGPWGGGNLFVRAICDFASHRGHQIVHDLSQKPDAILIVDPRYDDLRISINEISAIKKAFPEIRVLHRINECDARKNTRGMDELLRNTSSIADVSVFVSDWMREWHTRGTQKWTAPRTDVVYNGVDSDHFRPASEDEKVSRNKISLVAHHWSNNQMKGFDFYEAVDRFVSQNEKEYSFTYVGRHTGTFSKSTRIVSPCFGKALGDELRKHHVYISGSFFDPGPNHIIEAIASGLPTWVRTHGGGALEFAGNDRGIDDVESLISLLKDKDRLLSPCQNNKSFTNWKSCANSYFDILESL